MPAATLEYASEGTRARAAFPAKWWLLALSALSAINFWIPFVTFYGDYSPAHAFELACEALTEGHWPSGVVVVQALLSANFAASLPLLYFVARLCFGTLRRAECIAAYAVAILCAGADILLSLVMMDSLNRGARGSLFVLTCTILSLTALTLGAILAARLHRSHPPGTAPIAALLASYLAGAFWAFYIVIVSLYQHPVWDFSYLRPGPIVCLALCLDYALQLLLLWRNDRNWRTRAISP